jgi:hypothetical protein
MATDTTTRPPTLGANSTTADRSEWDRLIAAYRAAHAEWETASAAYSELEGVFFKEKPDRPTTPAEPLPGDMTLDELRTWEGPTDYFQQTEHWRAECDALRARTFGNAEAEADRLLDLETKALRAVSKYPVPSLATLAEKIDLLEEAYGSDLGAGDEAGHIIADFRRIIKTEG